MLKEVSWAVFWSLVPDKQSFDNVVQNIKNIDFAKLDLPEVLYWLCIVVLILITIRCLAMIFKELAGISTQLIWFSFQFAFFIVILTIVSQYRETLILHKEVPKITPEISHAYTSYLDYLPFRWFFNYK